MQDNHSIQSSIFVKIVFIPVDTTTLQGIECGHKTVHKVEIDTSTLLFITSSIHPGGCHKGIDLQLSIRIRFQVSVDRSGWSDIWILTWIVKEQIDL
jgi:hypothetical protein